jgi:hypothetical protein
MEGDLANIENIRRKNLEAVEGDTLVLEATLLDPTVYEAKNLLKLLDYVMIFMKSHVNVTSGTFSQK